MDQLQAFLGAAERNRKADIVTDAVMMRNATQATKQGFTDFVRSLSSAVPIGTRPPTIGKADVARLKALFGQRRSKEAPDGDGQ
jgi:hypothetical protein